MNLYWNLKRGADMASFRGKPEHPHGDIDLLSEFLARCDRPGSLRRAIIGGTELCAADGGLCVETREDLSETFGVATRPATSAPAMLPGFIERQ